MVYEYKEQLKELLPEYLEILEERGITENRKNDYWVCPFCGSGTNHNHTTGFHVIGGVKYMCFACGAKGDIYDLVAHIENVKGDYWRHKYNKALSILRPYLSSERPAAQPVHKQPMKIQKNDYSDYLRQCHANVGKNDYFRRRGLSNEIIEKFMLGFDPAKNLVTIPFNKNLTGGYIHRILFEGSNKYCKHGAALFNAGALDADSQYVFITEGQIDALSYEELGFPAIGLGGTNEVDRLVELLKQKPTDKILIIALDNDTAGRKATARLIDVLAEAEVECRYVVVSWIYGGHKDANECLTADRDGFRERVNKFLEMLNLGV